MKNIDLYNKYIGDFVDLYYLKNKYYVDSIDGIKSFHKKCKICNNVTLSTGISSIVVKPIGSQLYYRGVEIDSMIKKSKTKGYLFEEGMYLLLFGELPTEEKLEKFSQLLFELRTSFVNASIKNGRVISKNMMINLENNILSLYDLDSYSEDLSFENVFRQLIELTANISTIVLTLYSDFCKKYSKEKFKLIAPKKKVSIAEYILYILRGENNYSDLDVETLDIMLLIHAEHGGGNNSTYANYVVTTSGTDTYSSIVASIASLKGSKHGGANLKVNEMFNDLKNNYKDITEKNISEYIEKILNKSAFDKTGLIYGIGHAVYFGEDPRTTIMKEYALKLAIQNNKQEELKLYNDFERISKRMLSKNDSAPPNICANIDFYSGFVYSLLGIPTELFTPMFVISRIVGWSCHRLETIANCERLVRPIYNYSGLYREYEERENRR